MPNSQDDVTKLANSLRNKFEKLHPLSDECFIYKVPQRLRQLNEGLYTPKVVSIGPLHHGREELKAMEEIKIRYLRDFLQRTKAPMEEFLKYIKERETKLRKCYAESIELQSAEFVEMIFLDSVFLIEFSLRIHHQRNTGVDRIFTKPWMKKDVRDDLLLLENQLPLFIIKDLFELAKSKMQNDKPYEGVSMRELVLDLWEDLCINLFTEKSLEQHFDGARHFVDLIRLCLQPSELGQSGEVKTIVTPTITQLLQAGVKFKVGSVNSLFDIKFNHGTLEIPKLTIDDRTEALFRNLEDFEALNYGIKYYVNDYITIMSYLVNSPKDVEVLVEKGIIENFLPGSEEVSTMFRKLAKENKIDNSDFSYVGFIEDLNARCRSSWHHWEAALIQDHFNTPWASISIGYAVVILLLSSIQTIIAIRSSLP